MASSDSKLLIAGVNLAGITISSDYVHVDPASANSVDVEIWPDGTGLATVTVLESALAATGYNATTDAAYQGSFTGVATYTKQRISSVLENIRIKINITSGTWYARVTPLQSVSGPVTFSGVSAQNLSQVNGVGIALGQTNMAGSLPVVLASNQAAIPVTLGGLGQQVMASSSAVVIASDQSAVSIQGQAPVGSGPAGNPVLIAMQGSDTNVQLVTADALGNLQVALGSTIDNLDDNIVTTSGAPYPTEALFTSTGVETTVALTFNLAGGGPAILDLRSAAFQVENKTGQTITAATLRTSDTIGITADQGTTFTAAPAPSIANNTTGILRFPSIGAASWANAILTLTFAGATTNAGTAKVQARFSSQSFADVKSTTGTPSRPGLTTVVSTVLAANLSRTGATIYNEGAQTAYLGFFSGTTTTNYTYQLTSGGTLELPFRYTGIITGLTSTLTAQLQVTELAA